jgi:glycine betaine/proline transport system ATP-binding protein
VVGVRDASFSVRRGEIFCIMGLSGSGKSTLIRHINRLIEPSAGTILIEGQNINDLSQKDLRAMRAEKIGMVFQSMALMPHRTVLENVAFSQEVRGHDVKERTERALRAIKAVELDGWEAKYPDELSGGMQQRVGLARAIAADPSILLMDEPFSALDPLIRRQLQDKFMSLSAEMKKTTLFITHDLDEAIRIGHRIAIMKDGVLVQIGTPEDIVTNPVDDYVADFVAGISKLDLISAKKIMEPLEAYVRRNGPVDLAGWPEAHPDHSLHALVDLSIATHHPIIVTADGKPVGVVSKNALLRGIKGEIHAADQAA